MTTLYESYTNTFKTMSIRSTKFYFLSVLAHCAVIAVLVHQFGFEVMNITKTLEDDIIIEPIDFMDADPHTPQAEDIIGHTVVDKDGLKKANAAHVIDSYQKAVSSHVGSYFKQLLMKKDIRFSIFLLLKIDQTGHIVFHSVNGVNADKNLQELCERVVHASDPLPQPPTELMKDGFANFAIPIKMGM